MKIESGMGNKSPRSAADNPLILALNLMGEGKSPYLSDASSSREAASTRRSAVLSDKVKYSS